MLGAARVARGSRSPVITPTTFDPSMNGHTYSNGNRTFTVSGGPNGSRSLVGMAAGKSHIEFRVAASGSTNPSAGMVRSYASGNADGANRVALLGRDLRVNGTSAVVLGSDAPLNNSVWAAFETDAATGEVWVAVETDPTTWYGPYVIGGSGPVFFAAAVRNTSVTVNAGQASYAIPPRAGFAGAFGSI